MAALAPPRPRRRRQWPARHALHTILLLALLSLAQAQTDGTGEIPVPGVGDVSPTIPPITPVPSVSSPLEPPTTAPVSPVAPTPTPTLTPTPAPTPTPTPTPPTTPIANNSSSALDDETEQPVDTTAPPTTAPPAPTKAEPAATVSPGAEEESAVIPATGTPSSDATGDLPGRASYSKREASSTENGDGSGSGNGSFSVVNIAAIGSVFVGVALIAAVFVYRTRRRRAIDQQDWNDDGVDGGDWQGSALVPTRLSRRLQMQATPTRSSAHLHHAYKSPSANNKNVGVGVGGGAPYVAAGPTPTLATPPGSPVRMVAPEGSFHHQYYPGHDAHPSSNPGFHPGQNDRAMPAMYNTNNANNANNTNIGEVQRNARGLEARFTSLQPVITDNRSMVMQQQQQQQYQQHGGGYPGSSIGDSPLIMAVPSPRESFSNSRRFSETSSLNDPDMARDFQSFVLGGADGGVDIDAESNFGRDSMLSDMSDDVPDELNRFQSLDRDTIKALPEERVVTTPSPDRVSLSDWQLDMSSRPSNVSINDSERDFTFDAQDGLRPSSFSDLHDAGHAMKYSHEHEEEYEM